MQNNEVITRILSSKKYKGIDRNLVVKLVAKYKDEEKVKSKLHQVWGAYYSTRPDFKKLLKKLENKEISLSDIARIHSSTKERLKEYVEIFKYISENTPHNLTICDIGCGLNPLFALQVERFWEKYFCFDIDIAQQEFLESVFRAENRNDFETTKIISADILFALKLLPVLDQQEENGAEKFLSMLTSKYLVVSFPNRSLGGREKGMKENYQNKYLPIFENNGFELTNSKEFSNESVYILRNKNRT